MMKHSIKRKSGKLTIPALILLAVCIFGRPSNAQTSIYIFDTDKSSVLKTGGFAGVHETYPIQGFFELTVDANASAATFDLVEAFLLSPVSSSPPEKLGELFNMTELAGAVIDDSTIYFQGKTSDGSDSDINIRLTFVEDSAYLSGRITPPPNSADMFYYSLEAVAQRKYAGGTGEPNTPYQIATAEDLLLLGETTEDYDKHFILTDDIDLDPNLPGRKVFDKAVIAPEITYIYPQEFHDTPFSGYLDGQGHIISNLNIQGGSYLGLFGSLNSDARISNLGLEAVDVNGFGTWVGGLAGDSSASISSSYVTGVINGEHIVGGLVGYNNYGCISLCYNTSKVKGGSYVGGLVGSNCGYISSSYSTGRTDGVVDNYGNMSDVGGLVGYNEGFITVCYSTGSLSGEDYVGGLVGLNRGSINVCYSSVMILGNDDVGGLVGYNSGSILSSYSTGTVGGVSDVGGLVGRLSVVVGRGRSGNNSIGIVKNSFWDKESSGQDTSAGGTGLTTEEMQDPNTFITAGWDFIGETTNGTCDFWQLQEGAYPGLTVFAGIVPIEPNGAGITEEPYLITNIDELLTIWYRPMAHYRLDTDIDFSGIHRNLAVVPWLGGSFDGNDFCIQSIQIQGTNNLGMFGILGYHAEVMNLGLEDVSIEGTGYQIGGLAGLNLGSISASSNSGTVSGYQEVGGLVGSNEGNITASHSNVEVSGITYIGGLVGKNADWNTSGIITDSYSTGSVSGDEEVGGLVGDNGGNITSSYSTSSVSGNEDVGGLVGENWGNITLSYSNGAVSGEKYIGGLVGDNWGNITSSYSIGSVSGNENVGGLVGCNFSSTDIISSFWDAETSGLLNMCGIDYGNTTGCDDSFGKTTAEMQTESTFTDAGWDFVGEAANGTEDIWWINEGQDYPRLWWELIEDDINDPNEN
ncbi:MAG: hypothetical protein JW715_04575 [Sedimentisphaerales bacterium]|nr:hypothetical protein [Sedimentisphaerales bacterium]